MLSMYSCLSMYKSIILSLALSVVEKTIKFKM